MEAEDPLQAAEVVQELQAARGRLPPNVHLQRVLEVREAINDPSDPEAMRDARLKVREAIRNVVDVVWCDGSRCLFRTR